MFSREFYRRARQGCFPKPTAPDYLDGGYGWVIVTSSFICNMIVDGIPSCFGLFIKSFAETFQEDEGTVTYALSVNVGMHLLVGPVVGALCKRYSCRAVCIAGSILSTLAFILSLSARSTLVLSFMYGLLGGTGFGMIYISTVILVSYYFELRRSLAVSISICGTGFGTIVFPLLSRWLLQRFQWQGIHLVFALFTLSCSAFAVLLLPLEYFRPKTTSAEFTSITQESVPVKPNTSIKRSQVSYKQGDALFKVLEDDHVDGVDSDYSVNEKNEQLIKPTSELQALPNKGNWKMSSGLDVSIHPIKNAPETIDMIPSVYAHTTAQQLRKKEILKILLFTRIVLKKEYVSRSKLPLFSRRILNAMKSLRDMSGIEEETLEYEVFDFYEIKRSKSEDLTLLQRYIQQEHESFIELHLGESLPSNLNHYAYVINEAGLSMGQLQKVNPNSYNNAGTTRETIMNNYAYDETNHTEDVVDNVMYAANARNVQSLPVLDQIVCNEDSCLRETQSNQYLASDREQNEHESFVTNLWSTNITAPNFWTDNDLETTNSDVSFHSETLKQTNTVVFYNSIDETAVEEKCKRKESLDSAWWNSSSSVRKDMYYTGSIFTLKEYRDQADGEEYRKQNTVEVSILQEMWDKELLSNPVFILYILSNIFLLAGYYIPFVFLVNTAMSSGIDETKATILVSAVGLSNMFGRLFFGVLDSKKLMDSLLLNNISLVVSALSIISFPLCSHFYEYMVASVLFGFSQACVVCLTTTLLVRFFTLDKLTNSFGILQLFRGVAIMLGIPCSGYIYRRTQSYMYTYWVSAGFYTLSIILSCSMHFVLKPDRAKKQKYQKVLYRSNVSTNDETWYGWRQMEHL